VRIAPRPLTAVIVFLIYLAFFYGVWIVTGIEYDHVGDSADSLSKWYVAPT
jgi:CAAX protease family protein